MEQNMLAVLTENSKLRQENVSLRLKLRELQLGSSSTSPRDDYEHGLRQQRPFNIHQVLQDRLTMVIRQMFFFKFAMKTGFPLP
jgi:regulator of replication initiation timing